jgi:hypothetical protein
LDALGDMFSPDNMKSMVSGSMVLPKDAVKNGDSWTQDVNGKLPFGKVVGKTKYMYKGPIDQSGKTLDEIAIVPEFKNRAQSRHRHRDQGQREQGQGAHALR